MFHVASKSIWSKTSHSNNEIAIVRNKNKDVNVMMLDQEELLPSKKGHENCHLKEIKTMLKFIRIPFLNTD